MNYKKEVGGEKVLSTLGISDLIAIISKKNS